MPRIPRNLPNQDEDEGWWDGDKSLSWPAGKQTPVVELHKNLGALWLRMKDAEQDADERRPFLSVAESLASPNLLAHKDKGVKALTSCCLVDMLRLCAPDAPYTVEQLKVRRTEKRSAEAMLTDAKGYVHHHHYWCTSRSG